MPTLAAASKSHGAGANEGRRRASRTVTLASAAHVPHPAITVARTPGRWARGSVERVRDRARLAQRPTYRYNRRVLLFTVFGSRSSQSQ